MAKKLRENEEEIAKFTKNKVKIVEKNRSTITEHSHKLKSMEGRRLHENKLFAMPYQAEYRKECNPRLSQKEPCL